jgi:hypothetical protein
MKIRTFMLLAILIAGTTSCSSNEVSIVGNWVVSNPPKDFRGFTDFVITKENEKYSINIMGLEAFPLAYDPVLNEYTFRVSGLGPGGPPEKLILKGNLLINFNFVDFM